MLVGGLWRQQAHDHEDDEAHRDPVNDRGVREQAVHDHEDHHDGAARGHGSQGAGCGCAPPEQGAYYGHEQGAGQEVVGDRERPDHVADDQRDHQRDDAHEQGGHAVHQHPVVVAAGDLRAARGEHPLPDVLPDHQPEEEQQEVGEDRLPPYSREVEVGGRQRFLHPEEADGHDQELQEVREGDGPHPSRHGVGYDDAAGDEYRDAWREREYDVEDGAYGDGGGYGDHEGVGGYDDRADQ